MGIEIGLIIAGIGALVGVVGHIAAANSAAEAAAAQREARDIEGAQTKVQSLENRRQRIREERIRRARILAASENAGTGGSSGETGAVGALNSTLGGLISSSSGEGKANEGINKFNQIATDKNNEAQAISGFTGAIQNGLSSFGSIFDN